jgi:opacity protein-like surface antigen
MSNIFRKSLLSGCVLAGAALAAGPALAAGETIALQQEPAAVAAPATEVAQAEPVEVIEVESPDGWYLTVGAGGSWASSRGWNLRNNNPFLLNNNLVPSSPVGGDLDLGGGFAGEGGVGYDFGDFRTELTYVYNRSSLNRVNIDGGSINGFSYPGRTISSVSGALNSSSVFVNGYYDIKTGSRWVPYVGAGLGYTNVSTPSLSTNILTPLGTQLNFRTPSANIGVFGWQAKLGLTYVASYNWDVFVEGTYQGAGGFETNRVSYDALNSWGARAGFRYRFAKKEEVVVVPAPAPQPEPAPAPAPAPQPEPAPIRGLW